MYLFREWPSQLREWPSHCLTIAKRLFYVGEGSTLTRTDTHKHHRLMNAAKNAIARARMRIYC